MEHASNLHLRTLAYSGEVKLQFSWPWESKDIGDKDLQPSPVRKSLM